MGKLRVMRIVRAGKFKTRVETSDGQQLVLDNAGGTPFVGMELDIDEVKVSGSELRPLRAGDVWPELLGSLDG